MFTLLTWVDHFFWSYVGFVLIAFLGIYFTLKTRCFQLRILPSVIKTFFHFATKKSEEKGGVHPIKTFFASVGGMIGVGNVVGIVTAVQIGGPGALFWVWFAAFVGSLIKYSEIYLGLKHRRSNEKGSYDGGPMFFLQSAFTQKWIPFAVSLLLCIYGVEIYQFTVVSDALSMNWQINRWFIIATLLFFVIYAGRGGVARLGKICTWIMPFFIVSYLFMSLWVIGHEAAKLPAVLLNVVISAFTGHAALGGFAGSGILLALQHGVARAAYSADMGIGYDSIIQSESRTVYPERQARLSILGVCMDNLICTMSILLILVTGVWNQAIPASHLVQTALGLYFPLMHLFMPFFLFILGYTTIIAYFCVGAKCARFLSPRWGGPLYFLYACFAFLFFSFFDQTQVLLIMSLSGGSLLLFNLLGIFRLRHQIIFEKEKVPLNSL